MPCAWWVRLQADALVVGADPFLGAHRELIGAAASYAGKVLNGTKPAGLPVRRKTALDLFIDLKTARRFGLSLPPVLRACADEAIE